MLVNESKTLERLDGNLQHEIWRAVYIIILAVILKGYMNILAYIYLTNLF